jgi:hypothetical protein
MPSVVTLPNNAAPLPEGFAGPDVRYSEAFVAYVLERFTQPGDTVFDPFAGFGTTLYVAEQLGRVGYGVEWHRKRWEYAASRLQDPEHIRYGDSRFLERYDFPRFDFSLTSPPYMSRGDVENPFTNYTDPGGGYEQYLQDLQDIYRQLAAKMTPGGRVAIEAANLQRADGTVTTLAWDIARTIGEVLPFAGEIIIRWEPTYGYGYDHSYLLLFRVP